MIFFLMSSPVLSGKKMEIDVNLYKTERKKNAWDEVLQVVV